MALEWNYVDLEKDYVFCHIDGKPWHPNSLSNEFKKFLIQNNLRQIRYHDLRYLFHAMFQYRRF